MNHDEKITTIIHSFREVNRFFYKQMWNHADDLGTTMVQLQIMKLVSEHPNISLQELAKKMNINKSTVSNTVDRIVKASYIRREQSPHDRRAIILNLTDEGREKEKEGRKIFLERLGNLAEISDEDIEALVRIHQLVKQKIEIDGGERNEG